MDDLLINKIAPLCPFLYLTLRLVCKKYWKALDRKNIKDFGRIFSFYLQKRDLYLTFSLLEDREQVFFIRALEPEFEGRYIVPISAKPIGYPRGIVFYLSPNLLDRPIDRIIGGKNHENFAEYVCQNMCQLKCCGNTWYNYLASLRRHWMLSYDDVNKVFILECFSRKKCRIMEFHKVFLSLLPNQKESWCQML
jgi:hypothetical protein